MAASGSGSFSLQATDNFIWSTQDRIGAGVSCVVYKGYDKSSGGEVAVKVFNNARSYPHMQAQEMEMLAKVEHGNIVRFLGNERITKDRGSGMSVGRAAIFMELCNGGSLSALLQRPENMFGLPEERLLRVITDIGRGLEYLRNSNMIHRDIKPGNIMRCITDDGREVYKLVDFGAARVLEEDEEFQTLVGTEEYLHPSLYKCAVLEPGSRHGGQTFSASSDLWSVGVTLCQLIMGELPFKPFGGGRHNRQTMYEMIKQKPHGSISATQIDSAGGEIMYRDTLPRTCHVSSGLSELLLPILSGVMEYSREHQMSFPHFFASLRRLASKCVVHVFDTRTCRIHRVYVTPPAVANTLSVNGSGSSTLSEVNRELSKASQCGVDVRNQILFYKGQLLCDDDKDVELNTSDQTPIILYHHVTAAADNNVVEPPQQTIVESDTTLIKELADCVTLPTGDTVDIREDIKFARACAKISYHAQRVVETSINKQALLIQAHDTSLKYLSDQFRDLCTKCDGMHESRRLVDALVSHYKSSIQIISDMAHRQLLTNQPASNADDDVSESSSKIVDLLQQMKYPADQATDTDETRRGAWRCYRQVRDHLTPPSQSPHAADHCTCCVDATSLTAHDWNNNPCISRVGFYTEQICDILTDLEEELRQGVSASYTSQSEQQQQLHVQYHYDRVRCIKRTKLWRLFQQTVTHASDHCLRNLNSLYHSLRLSISSCSEWLSQCVTLQRQVTEWCKTHVMWMKSAQTTLDKCDEHIQRLMERVGAVNMGGDTVLNSRRVPKKQAAALTFTQSLCKGLRDISNVSSDVHTYVQANNELLVKHLSLLATVTTQSPVSAAANNADTSEAQQ